jgi:hypothetical protein
MLKQRGSAIGVNLLQHVTALYDVLLLLYTF